MNIFGMPVVVSDFCGVPVPNYKESRHRSKRIMKKLNKRFGGPTKIEPRIYIIGGKMFAHPEQISAISRCNRDYILR